MTTLLHRQVVSRVTLGIEQSRIKGDDGNRRRRRGWSGDACGRANGRRRVEWVVSRLKDLKAGDHIDLWVTRGDQKLVFLPGCPVLVVVAPINSTTASRSVFRRRILQYGAAPHG